MRDGRGVGRGEKEGRGEYEKLGRSSWGKNRKEAQGKRYLDGAITKLTRNLALGNFPEIYKNEPS